LAAYYEDINRRQESLIKGIVESFTLMTLLSCGIQADKKAFTIKFYPLNKLGAVEKAAVAAQSTDTIIKAFESTLISQQVATKELKQLCEETGFFSNVTDDDIEAADDKPPVMEIEQPESAGDAKPMPDGASWITLESGQHVMIGKNGQVIAGAGGALNGKYYGTHGVIDNKESNSLTKQDKSGIIDSQSKPAGTNENNKMKAINTPAKLEGAPALERYNNSMHLIGEMALGKKLTEDQTYVLMASVRGAMINREKNGQRLENGKELSETQVWENETASEILKNKEKIKVAVSTHNLENPSKAMQQAEDFFSKDRLNEITKYL